MTGRITVSPGAKPRPLTRDEAEALFAAMAALTDRIAFGILQEGCESRSQVMIEEMLRRGIDPGRAWALSVGKHLSVINPAKPKTAFKWNNHTAPTVTTGEDLESVLVIDPSIPGTKGPLPLREWTVAMRVRSVVIVESPLSQAGILEMQRERALAGEALDAVVFHLARGTAPIPEIGGSGFRIAPDPPEGISAFASAEMRRLLALQRAFTGE